MSIFKGYEKKFLQNVENLMNKCEKDDEPFHWGYIYNSKNKIYTDEIKYLAEQKEENHWKKQYEAGNMKSYGGFEFSTSFDIKETKFDYKNGQGFYKYNPKAALAITNLDFSLLSIFYFFEFLDVQTGNFVDIEKNLFAASISSLFASNPKDYLKDGRQMFDLFYNMRIFQLDTYIKMLQQNNISFEKKLAYFIEVYLPNNYNLCFDVRSDLENLVKTESYNYKCRIMCTMIESICNQYKEIVSKGSFDIDFLMKYGSFNLEVMEGKSLKRAILKDEKTIYKYLLNSNNFAGVTDLTSTRTNLYDFVLDNEPKYEDIIKNRSHLKEPIDKLIEVGVLKQEGDIIKLNNKEKIYIMKLLLEQESIIIVPNINKQLLKELHEEGEIDIGENLFSKKELDYLDFHLNNKKFDDSLALRNKYQHNGHTGKVEKDYPNYLTLLKVLMLILLRINQDQELLKIDEKYLEDDQ